MTDGKSYEIFVQQLQQVLLDAEPIVGQKNIAIERNKKLAGKMGAEREFDLYWEYELGGIVYKTVIECKDYASTITIDRIDAFVGKLNDFPDLKGVFATRTGYQSGAEKKAEYHKIDLLIVREQRDDDWQDSKGNPFIKQVNIGMKLLLPTRIDGFYPFVDGEWLATNTKYTEAELANLGGMTNEIFIEDLDDQETYALSELTERLDKIFPQQFGRLSHAQKMNNAYLVYCGLRLKIHGYKVDFIRTEPVNLVRAIDFSENLLGVIEYLQKGTTTAVFSDKIIKDWK